MITANKTLGKKITITMHIGIFINHLQNMFALVGMSKTMIMFQQVAH